MSTGSNTMLEGFIETEIKYEAAPIPAHLPREDVAAFVAELHGRELISRNTLAQLQRLEIFFDIREGVADYRARLQRFSEPEKLNVGSAVLVIDALSWLGGTDEIQVAREAFYSVAQRADWTSELPYLRRGAFALGTQEAIDQLRNLADRQQQEVASRLSGLGDDAADGVTAALENHMAQLQDFSRFDLTEVQEANRIREAVTQAEGDPKLAALISLYLETSEQATPDLALWAAYTLARLKDRGVRDQVAQKFLEIADQYGRPDDRESEEALVAARALRAAVFLGRPLDEERLLWLVEVDDEGFDLLALRPMWTYTDVSEEAQDEEE